MNKNIRGLVFEIIIMILIIISTFLIFSNDKISKERDELIAFGNSSLDISLVSECTDKIIKKIDNENYDCDVLLVKNNTNYKTKYNLIFKITKIKDINGYSIMVNSKKYNLNELKFKEDADYYYFTINDFEIYNKNQYITTALFLNDNYNGNDSFSYSYMIEVIR